VSDSAAEDPKLTWSEVLCQHCPAWDPFPFEEKCEREGCTEKHVGAKGLCRNGSAEFHSHEFKGMWPTTNFDDWCVEGRMMVMEAQSED
jgi:hypothetical protein